ncbi:MAG TPA: competence/damage-inducible protein A [Candidatus Tumulicola sp.]
MELIAVGTELLLGQLVDTNTPWIAQQLSATGIDVFGTHAIGDNRERIASVVRDVLTRRDGAILTGGLGPTVDDLTKEAVCDALGLETELYEAALTQMVAVFKSFGRPMPENNRKQAELPRGSRPMVNPNGTAPGFIAFASDGRFVACMPGVPSEMKPMMTAQLLPWLRERFSPKAAIFTRIVHTIGIGESDVDQRIEDLFRSSENPKIAVLAHAGRTDVKIMAKATDRDAAERAIAPLQGEIERRLDGFVYGRDDETLAAAVAASLRGSGLSLATAESCTGGRVAAAITERAGASKTYVGGIVAYDNALKIAALGVPEGLLAKDGAVSQSVVEAMARGACGAFSAGIAVATTGIAGPDGGTADKPVGLVWFAVAAAGGATLSRQVRFRGDRVSVQTRATTYALGLLWRFLRGERA